ASPSAAAGQGADGEAGPISDTGDMQDADDPRSDGAGAAGPASAPRPAIGRQSGAVARSDVLVVNMERIRRNAAAARSLESQADGIRAALRREFERRRDALSEEEKALAALQKSLEPDAFEARAARFEQQVRVLKLDRRRQGQALQLALRTASEQMDLALQPILAEIMAEREATIMIDNRNVVLSATALDVTQIAINRLDEALPTLEVQWPLAALPE
ncbi:MAG: OmpH family outer membrane protein, partial [Pseudomonadota bacterium]